MAPLIKKIKSKKKESLKDKVHRHLADKNDIITDEDIMNIEVGNEESEKSFRIEVKEKMEEIKDKQTGTWDVNGRPSTSL